MYNGRARAAGADVAAGVGSHPGPDHRHHHLGLPLPPEAERSAAAAAPGPLALQEHVNSPRTRHTHIITTSVFSLVCVCPVSRTMLNVKRHHPVTAALLMCVVFQLMYKNRDI